MDSHKHAELVRNNEALALQLRAQHLHGALQDREDRRQCGDAAGAVDCTGQRKHVRHQLHHEVIACGFSRNLHQPGQQFSERIAVRETQCVPEISKVNERELPEDEQQKVRCCFLFNKDLALFSLSMSSALQQQLAGHLHQAQDGDVADVRLLALSGSFSQDPHHGVQSGGGTGRCAHQAMRIVAS